MNFPLFLLNNLCAWGTVPWHRHFTRHIPQARRIQEQILAGLIHRNRDTDFGREYSFATITDSQTYRERVPLMTYDDYRPWIDLISQGQPRVLTREAIRLFEPTGGSSGGSKYIPYTRSLGREFQNGIKTWLYDLYRQYPQLRTGRSYWAITPAVRTPQEFGKIPVGFEQDADYFGWLGQIISRTFAVPPAVKMVRHVENFKYLSAFFLLRCQDLTLVSVWNPTFLLLLLRDIERYYDQIIADLRTGGVSLPVNEDISAVLPYVRSDSARARELEVLRPCNGHQDYALIWPRLKIISCWEDGAAAGYAQQLRQVFPGVTIQGKGLLATEAVITIPWSAAGGNIPAYTSHFLEFIPEKGEHSLLLDELTEGETYTVVVTTGGGLYRYDMGDCVLVTGHYKGLPLLKFIGRAQVVDLVGEKLEEHHVQNVITDILSRLRIETCFVMLAPQETPEGGFYILYIEPAESGQENSLRQMRVLLDSALKENMQYAYARNIGQLRSLRIFQIDRTGDQGYYDRCLKEGQRLGDIKPAVLDRRSGWMDYFQGRLLDTDSGTPAGEVKTSSGGHT